MGWVQAPERLSVAGYESQLFPVLHRMDVQHFLTEWFEMKNGKNIKEEYCEGGETTFKHLTHPINVFVNMHQKE